MDQTNAELTDETELAVDAPADGDVAGLDEPSGLEDDAPADGDVAGLDEPSASEDTAGPSASEDTAGPSVDELEGQLGSIQRAMDQLQAGDLDGAEATIEALEQRVGALAPTADVAQ